MAHGPDSLNRAQSSIDEVSRSERDLERSLDGEFLLTSDGGVQNVVFVAQLVDLDAGFCWLVVKVTGVHDPKRRYACRAEVNEFGRDETIVVVQPEPGEVLHFSEDLTIATFVPHVAATARQGTPYVWAVNAERCSDYWFPRRCPRAMAWRTPHTTDEDAATILGAGGGDRVHAVEFGWLEAIRQVELYAYRLPAEPFQPIGLEPTSHERAAATPFAMASLEPVEPLGPPERVGDLLTLHEEAGIQLRVLPNLWPFWDAVIESTLEFSGIQLRNARPRPGHDT